ncbi:MAG: hypothetical protein ABW199_11050 [Caulobacterales bacterium]
MFVEQKPEEKIWIVRFAEEQARKRPGLFAAFLAVFSVLVGFGLLWTEGYTAVLYQGF